MPQRKICVRIPSWVKKLSLQLRVTVLPAPPPPLRAVASPLSCRLRQADEVSDEEEEEGETSGGPGPCPGPGPGPSPVRPADKFRPASLEKMISLVALLVEKSRTDDQRLSLSASDLAAVAGTYTGRMTCFSRRWPHHNTF